METLNTTYKLGDLITYSENIVIDTEPVSEEGAEFYLGFLKEDKNYVKFDIYEKDNSVWGIDTLISELVICKDAMFYLPVPQQYAFEMDRYLYPTEEIVFVEGEITSVEQIVDFAKDMLKHKYNILGA